MAQEEGKKYSQLVKIKTFDDTALIAVDNGETELNTILWNDLKLNKLDPIFATKAEISNKLSIDNIKAGENIELSKEGSNVIITSIPTSDPAVLAALQYINGTEVLKDEIEIDLITNHGGTHKLLSNHIYSMELLNENTFFVPPTLEEINTAIHNQITIFFTYNKVESAEGQPTVSFGENVQMVNGLTINFELGKSYRVFYEFSPAQNLWVCGVVMNSETIY